MPVYLYTIKHRYNILIIFMKTIFIYYYGKLLFGGQPRSDVRIVVTIYSVWFLPLYPSSIGTTG